MKFPISAAATAQVPVTIPANGWFDETNHCYRLHRHGLDKSKECDFPRDYCEDISWVDKAALYSTLSPLAKESEEGAEISPLSLFVLSVSMGTLPKEKPKLVNRFARLICSQAPWVNYEKLVIFLSGDSMHSAADLVFFLATGVKNQAQYKIYEETLFFVFPWLDKRISPYVSRYLLRDGLESRGIARVQDLLTRHLQGFLNMLSKSKVFFHDAVKKSVIVKEFLSHHLRPYAHSGYFGLRVLIAATESRDRHKKEESRGEGKTSFSGAIYGPHTVYLHRYHKTDGHPDVTRGYFTARPAVTFIFDRHTIQVLDTVVREYNEFNPNPLLQDLQGLQHVWEFNASRPGSPDKHMAAVLEAYGAAINKRQATVSQHLLNKAHDLSSMFSEALLKPMLRGDMATAASFLENCTKEEKYHIEDSIPLLAALNIELGHRKRTLRAGYREAKECLQALRPDELNTFLLRITSLPAVELDPEERRARDRAIMWKRIKPLDAEASAGAGMLEVESTKSMHEEKVVEVSCDADVLGTNQVYDNRVLEKTAYGRKRYHNSLAAADPREETRGDRVTRKILHIMAQAVHEGGYTPQLMYNLACLIMVSTRLMDCLRNVSAGEHACVSLFKGRDRPHKRRACAVEQSAAAEGSKENPRKQSMSSPQKRRRPDDKEPLSPQKTTSPSSHR